MINAIPSGPPGNSAAMPIHEAVLRYGGTQELRDRQRQESGVDAVQDKIDLPTDLAFVDESQGPPPQGGDTPQAAGQEARAQAGGERREAGETRLRGEHKPGQDGQEQQREAALAQHAVEQQGKRELGRTEGDRSQRCTREMMGRTEGVHKSGGSEQAQTSHAPSTPTGPRHAPSHSPAPRGGGAGSASVKGGGSGRAHASAGGRTAATGFAPRVGGDVLAAAVGSGMTGVPDTKQGTAHGRDEEDDEAQQVDSSQEAIDHGHAEQGTKAARKTGFDTHLEFGGEGERERKFDRRSQEHGSRDSEGRDGETAQEAPEGCRDSTGTASDDAPEQEPAAETTSDDAPEQEPAKASEEFSDERSEGPVASGEAGDHADASAVARHEVPLQPSIEPVEEAASAVLEPAVRAVTLAPDQPPAPEADVRPAQPDQVERRITLSPGLSLLGNEEYFFFDDARATGEAEAEAS